MSSYDPNVIINAVSAICPDIEDRVLRSSNPFNERQLWWELSACILSSQVPYSLAVAAADVIDQEGLLYDVRQMSETLPQRLVKVLSEPIMVKGRPRKYRFPVARAQYLATTHTIIKAQQCSLREFVDSFQEVSEARNWFVKYTPGLGPKQASMFLRNAGVSYDLAILDRHVLNYMSKLCLFSGAKLIVTGFAQYIKYEEILRKHAEELNSPVGILDWAIWIVMRVANRTQEGAII